MFFINFVIVQKETFYTIILEDRHIHIGVLLP